MWLHRKLSHDNFLWSRWQKCRTAVISVSIFICKISRQGCWVIPIFHYNDVIMSAMTSQINNLTIVYSAVYWGTDKRKHQSSASLAFVRGIHRWLVNSSHKGPVMRKMFPFDDVIMFQQRNTVKHARYSISDNLKHLVTSLHISSFSFITSNF